MSIIYHTNMKEFLETQFELRSARNASYSMRAFARDIGVSPTQLSRYLRGMKGLSFSTAERILESFTLNELQRKFLLSSVLCEHARSGKEREAALAKLKEINSRAYQAIRDEDFILMSDWHHIAILALSEVPGFRADPAWVAKKLSIPVAAAEAALTRMVSLGVVTPEFEVNASYFADFENSSEEARAALREFHRQVIAKAGASLQTPAEARDISTLMLSVDASRVEEARAFIREFREAFDRRFSMEVRKDQKDAVYAFGIQFFKICRMGEETPNPKDDDETVRSVS